MTLHTRVLAGLAVVIVSLAAGLWALLRWQHGAELSIVDARLVRAAASAPAPPGPSEGAAPAPAGILIGRVAPGGAVSAVVVPDTEPGQVPVLTDDRLRPWPHTVPLAGGPAEGGPERYLRAVVVAHDGQAYVYGLSLDDVASRQATLTRAVLALFVAACAVLALVAWQVLRLGVRPLRQMADYADVVSAEGPAALRPTFAPGTEAGRLAHALGRAIDQKSDAVDRLESFVADTSHELLNPLSTITGYAQLQLAGRLDDRAALHDAMVRVDQEAQRASRIVDELATLSLATTSDPDAVADASVLVADLYADLTAFHPDRAVAVDIDDAVFVACEPDLLVQAVGALVRNALQHTGAQVGLELSVHAVGDMARIEISDGGPGIDAHHLPYLFDRFYRADKGRDDGPGGSGLGLAVAASIARSCHGRHGVSSGPDGSVFWLEFPLAARPTPT